MDAKNNPRGRPDGRPRGVDAGGRADVALVGRRVARFAVLAVLVAGLASTAFVGSAAAYQSYDACVDDRGVGWTLSCFVSYDDLVASDALEWEGQSSASFASSDLDTRVIADYQTVDSQLDEVKNMAYAEGQIAFAEAIANGSGKATAYSRAHNASVEYLKNQINNKFFYKNEEYISTLAYINNQTGTDVQASGYSVVRFDVNRTYTVFSGTQDAYTKNYSGLENSQDVQFAWIPPDSVTVPNNFTVVYSDDGLENTDIGAMQSRWSNQLSDYEAIRAEVTGELEAWAMNVSASEFEDLNASDLLSPAQKAIYYGQNYSETGSSGFAAGLASMTNTSIGAVGNRYEVHFLESGFNRTGVLYGDYEDFNGSIQVDKRYDGANMTAWVAVTDGTGSIAIKEDFHVHSITTADGESVNSTSLQTYSYTTLDPDQPLKDIQKYLNLTRSVDSHQEPTSGGFFGGSGGMMLALALVAGFLLALRSKSQSGNGGKGL